MFPRQSQVSPQQIALTVFDFLEDQLPECIAKLNKGCKLPHGILNQDGESFLHVAVRLNNPELITALDCRKPNQLDGKGRTAGLKAAQEKKWGCVKAIAKRAVSDGETTFQFYQILQLAVEDNRPDVISILLNAGATYAIDGFDIDSPALKAVLQANWKCAKLFRQHSSKNDNEIRIKSLISVLSYIRKPSSKIKLSESESSLAIELSAAKVELFSLLELIIELHVDNGNYDSLCNTHWNIIKILTSHDVSLEWLNDRVRYYSMCRAIKEKNKYLCTSLLDYDPDLEKEYDRKNDVKLLHIFVERNFSDLILLFKKRATTEHEANAALLAAKQGKWKCVQAITKIAKCSNVNYYETLQLAVKARKRKVIKSLLIAKTPYAIKAFDVDSPALLALETDLPSAQVFKQHKPRNDNERWVINLFSVFAYMVTRDSEIKLSDSELILTDLILAQFDPILLLNIIKQLHKGKASEVYNAEGANWSAIKALVSNATSRNWLSQNIITYVMYRAIKEGDPALCFPLLKLKPNLEYQFGEKENTALHLAALHNNPYLISAFKRCNVTIDAKNKDGEEPIELIRRLKYRDCGIAFISDVNVNLYSTREFIDQYASAKILGIHLVRVKPSTTFLPVEICRLIFPKVFTFLPAAFFAVECGVEHDKLNKQMKGMPIIAYLNNAKEFLVKYVGLYTYNNYHRHYEAYTFFQSLEVNCYRRASREDRYLAMNNDVQRFVKFHGSSYSDLVQKLKKYGLFSSRDVSAASAALVSMQESKAELSKRR